MKKELVVFTGFLFILIILMSFVSAGFLSELWGKITGKVIYGYCTDSDRGSTSGYGDNPYSKGTFEGSSDFCTSNYYLTEYYCQEDASGKFLKASKEYNCGSFGMVCQEGKCVAPPISCPDTDAIAPYFNGKNYYLKGTYGSYTDSCVYIRRTSTYTGQIYEYYCNADSSMGYELYMCPNGCDAAKGACVQLSCVGSTPNLIVRQVDVSESTFVDPNDFGCCASSSDCVVNGNCYESGKYYANPGPLSGCYDCGEFCLDNIWYDEATDAVWCGNGACQTGETCVTCPGDCGACECVVDSDCSTGFSCVDNACVAPLGSGEEDESEFGEEEEGAKTSIDCFFYDPRDLEQKRILISDLSILSKAGIDSVSSAEVYCIEVKGCTGVDESSINIFDDFNENIKTCRCQSPAEDYCKTYSCQSLTDYRYERIGSVICTGCPSGVEGCMSSCEVDNDCPMSFVCNDDGVCELSSDPCGDGFCDPVVKETSNSCFIDCGYIYESLTTCLDCTKNGYNWCEEEQQCVSSAIDAKCSESYSHYTNCPEISLKTCEPDLTTFNSYKSNSLIKERVDKIIYYEEKEPSKSESEYCQVEFGFNRLTEQDISETNPFTDQYTRIISILDIEPTDTSLEDAELNFNLKDSEINYPDLISFYIWDDEKEDWASLEVDTTSSGYFGSGANAIRNYLVKVPHFSLFLIAEPIYCGNGKYDPGMEQCDETKPGTTDCTNCVCDEGYEADEGSCVEDVEGDGCAEVGDIYCGGHVLYTCNSDLVWKKNGTILEECGVECYPVGNTSCQGEYPLKCGFDYQWIIQEKVNGLCGYVVDLDDFYEE